MESQSFVKTTRWQFSLRAILVALAVFAACLAIVTALFRRSARQSFVVETVLPIIDDYVASVGYSNGRILWLRVNDIDPHHPSYFTGYTTEQIAEEFHQWAVPMYMEMYINDGSFGPYKTFGDYELRKFVAEHPHIRALDLRHSGVTDAGLIAVSKLKRLEWLWLDSNQSTELGLAHLHDVPSLRTIRLDLQSIDPELIGALRNALENCDIENNSESMALRASSADEA
jgi:hypothetical protein